MALPGGFSLNFQIFVRQSEYTNKLVHTQRTSLDDIWCWFWKESSRPFALDKNNFKRCIRTTISMRCWLFQYSLFNLLLFQPPSIRYMKIWHWIRISFERPLAHISSLAVLHNLFYSSVHFFQGPAKAQSFSSLLLGICEEERSKGVGRLVLLKKATN